MRRTQSTLHSVALPLLPLLPMMGFSLSQVPDYLRSDEFRNLAGEFVIQVTTGVVDAVILGVITLLFGTTG